MNNPEIEQNIPAENTAPPQPEPSAQETVTAEAPVSPAGESAPAAGAMPDYVSPVDEADRVKPPKIDDGGGISDYVVPEQTFRQHLKDRNRSAHTGKTKTATPEEMEAASEGFLFTKPPKRRKRKRHHHHHHHHHSSSGSSKASGITKGTSESSDTKQHHHHHHHHHRHRRKKKWVKVVVIIVSILLSLVFLAVFAFFALKELGRQDMQTTQDFALVVPTEPSQHKEIFSVDGSGRTIVYEGKTYRFNEKVIGIAVIGVDHDIQNNSVQSMGDSINLAALDTETGKITIISISRDTMCDVNLYSDEGNYIDTERLQIAYAYSFGNESVTGGKNTTDSLQKLFFGLPIINYFAINMEALTTLNDAIGGVTLTSSITFYSPIDGRLISAGDTVTLHGREVEYYVRTRNTEELASNNDRVLRQQEYIRAFINQVIPMIKNDMSIVTELYNIIEVNSDSTLNLPKMTYLASTMANKLSSIAEISYRRLDGKVVEGEYAEFIVDDKSALETMLDVFYTPVE